MELFNGYTPSSIKSDILIDPHPVIKSNILGDSPRPSLYHEVNEQPLTTISI